MTKSALTGGTCLIRCKLNVNLKIHTHTRVHAREHTHTHYVKMIFITLFCYLLHLDIVQSSSFPHPETKNEGFSKDVCRSMVAMMDVDRSGKLGFEEFKTLWIDIRHWKVKL